MPHYRDQWNNPYPDSPAVLSSYPGAPGTRIVGDSAYDIAASRIAKDDQPLPKQVAEELGLLGITLDDLHEAAVELSRRLNPLLNDHYADDNDPSAIVSLVPIAEAIRLHRNRAQTVLDLIRSITDRLEI